MSFTATSRCERTNQFITLVTEDCCQCHILFAFPQELKEKLMNDSSILFYCPKGHPQIYTDNRLKTLEAKLQRAREESWRETEQRCAAERERDHHWTERKKTNTRFRHLKERVKHGICPCCHRQFEDVKRHMATKHPNFAKEEPTA